MVEGAREVSLPLRLRAVSLEGTIRWLSIAANSYTLVVLPVRGPSGYCNLRATLQPLLRQSKPPVARACAKDRRKCTNIKFPFKRALCFVQKHLEDFDAIERTFDFEKMFKNNAVYKDEHALSTNIVNVYCRPRLWAPSFPQTVSRRVLVLTRIL